MANKYSKSNNSVKQQEQKTMQDFERSRKKLNKTAKVMAIIMILVMVIFTVIGSISFLIN